METIRVRLTGRDGVPMFQQNDRLANPFSKYAQKLQELNAKKKGKKGEEQLQILAEMNRVEWEGGLYRNDRLGSYVPGKQIMGSLIGGAKMDRNGSKVKRAVIPANDAPIFIHGNKRPPSVREMWGDGDTEFIDRRICTVGQAKVLKARPTFHDWSIEFELTFDPKAMSQDELLSAFEKAGAYHGMGTARSIGMGRYDVELLS